VCWRVCDETANEVLGELLDVNDPFGSSTWDSNHNDTFMTIHATAEG